MENIGSTTEASEGNETIGVNIDSDTDDAVAQADASTENAGNLEDSQFEYNGNVISILDDNFEAMDKALGGYDPKHSDLGSYSYGDDKEAYFYFDALDYNGSPLPVSITIMKDIVTTSRGIKVGSSRDEVISAYGNPNVEPPKGYGPDGKELTGDAYNEIFGEPLIYDMGDYRVTFSVENGNVNSITYQNDVNHDKFSWS